MDTSGTAKWNTLFAALAAIGETRVGCDEEQMAMLDEYQDYLQARIAAGG